MTLEESKQENQDSSTDLLVKLKALVAENKLTGFWLGEESMGYHVDLTFSDSEQNGEANLDKTIQKKLTQLFHDWAGDKAGDVGWGFYDLSISEDGKIRVESSGEYEAEVETPVREWEKEILSTILPDLKDSEYDNYSIDLSIEHRRSNGIEENFSTFRLSVNGLDDLNEYVEVAISEAVKKLIYDKLVKVFYENAGLIDELEGFVYETDELGMLDMTRVFINSGLADDLDNYFESQRS